MELHRFLMQSHTLGAGTDAKRLAVEWTPSFVKKGACLAHQGAPEASEYIVLEGRVASRILDPEGRAVCVGLYSGPCVITPNVARTGEGISRVSLEAMSDTLVMQMPSQRLINLMLASEPIREWANGVLREELGRKADREWCLAALGGSDRLAWFRSSYPAYEELFNHSYIASYLGITPVTLSRLRKASESK